MLIVDKFIDRQLPEWNGRTAFIVGSGPSLDRIDLGLLRGRVILALNAAITLFKDSRVYPNAYWTFRDRRAIGEVAPRLAGMDRLRVVTSEKGFDAVQCSVRGLKSLRGYLYHEKSVVHARTVAEDALQLAMRGGCARAILVGVDCHAPTGQPYAKALSWKPCAWYDPENPPADGGESKACLSMLAALRALATSGKLEGFPVHSTSLTCDAFPFTEYQVAVSIRDAEAV